MKRFFLILMLFLTVSVAHSQVFNTGQTLKPKLLSLGLEPAVVINGRLILSFSYTEVQAL